MAQPGIISEKEFARLITTRDSFTAIDMQTIERLIARYPYCQAFYFIKSAALKRSGSEQGEGPLQLSAAFAANREMLFRFVERPRELKVFFEPQEPEAISVAPEKGSHSESVNAHVVEDVSDLGAEIVEETVVAEDLKESVLSEVTSPVPEEEIFGEQDVEFKESETDRTLEPDSINEPESETDENIDLLDTEEEASTDAVAALEPVVDADEPDAYLTEVQVTVPEEQGVNLEPASEMDQEVVGVDSWSEFEFQNALTEASTDEEIDTGSIGSEEQQVNAQEEDVFEEIAEVSSFEAVALVAEEHYGVFNEVENTVIKSEDEGEDFSEIETEIPEIETPWEEFSKPESELDDLQEDLLQFEDIDIPGAGELAIQRAPLSDIASEIETVIPDFDLPDFDFDENQEPEMIDTVEGVFHVEPEVPAEVQVPATPEFPEERLIVDSVAARDYFVFDRSVVDPLKEDEREASPAVELPAVTPLTTPVEASASAEKKPERVSKYNDDTLPFSFLWWLHKTRKEYDSTYQPYSSRPSLTNQGDASADLNQQIIESIFHAQPELNTFPEQTQVTYTISPKKREGDLIERFIKEEPHIKPPLPDKLDTENKAKKSSEDTLDLVSETLAKIYIDQMLFHKAIDTYKKLSLKFPEKKLYFADQISELEKKIN